MSEPEPDVAEQIASDSQIYASVETKNRTIDVTPNATRPELPDLHKELKQRIEEERINIQGNQLAELSDIANVWFVGISSETHTTGNFETWVPATERALRATQHRLRLHYNNNPHVTINHNVSEYTNVNYVEVVNANDLPDEIIFDNNNARLSVENAYDNFSPVLLRNNGCGSFCQWVRVSSGGPTPTFNMYIPQRDFEYEIDNQSHVSVLIPWTDGAILQASRDAEGVINRQDGLYVSQIHSVSDEYVPDTEDLEQHQGVYVESESDMELLAPPEERPVSTNILDEM